MVKEVQKRFKCGKPRSPSGPQIPNEKTEWKNLPQTRITLPEDRHISIIPKEIKFFSFSGFTPSGTHRSDPNKKTILTSASDRDSI